MNRIWSSVSRLYPKGVLKAALPARVGVSFENFGLGVGLQRGLSVNPFYRNAMDESTAAKYLKDMPENWAETFAVEDIPRQALQTQFVRSSGPGGQNVNKVSTKAEVRFSISQASWLPAYVKAKLREQEGKRINRRDEYIITADDTRSQVTNLESCIAKLHTQLVHAGQVAKGPDAEKQSQVEKMKIANREKRLRDKQFRSSRKASRRGDADR